MRRKRLRVAEASLSDAFNSPEGREAPSMRFNSRHALPSPEPESTRVQFCQSAATGALGRTEASTSTRSTAGAESPPPI